MVIPNELGFENQCIDILRIISVDLSPSQTHVSILVEGSIETETETERDETGSYALSAHAGGSVGYTDEANSDLDCATKQLYSNSPSLQKIESQRRRVRREKERERKRNREGGEGGDWTEETKDGFIRSHSGQGRSEFVPMSLSRDSDYYSSSDSEEEDYSESDLELETETETNMNIDARSVIHMSTGNYIRRSTIYSIYYSLIFRLIYMREAVRTIMAPPPLSILTKTLQSYNTTTLFHTITL